MVAFSLQRARARYPFVGTGDLGLSSRRLKLCTKMYQSDAIELFASATGYQYTGVTPWMPAMAFKGGVQGLLEMLDAEGQQVSSIIGFQTAATDTTDPGAWAALEATPTVVSAAGTKIVTAIEDQSSNLDSVFYVRFGIGVKIASGNGRALLRLSMIGST
jgi:hypothetical protein